MSSEAGKARSRRLAIVLLGILGGQLILYGASFAGTKILLPLDILTLPDTYIPLQPGQIAQQPHNEFLTDPILEDEPSRLFRNSELWAGRLPIWNPYEYAGVPNISFLSPFAILAALVRSPRILPWVSLSAALVSGFGAFAFSRRVLQVGFWPATIAGWCYPVTGFFVLWQSHSLSYPIVWLPWLLLAIDAVALRSSRWAFPAVVLATMLTLISGHLDMAALVLLVGGVFAVWNFFSVFRNQGFGPEATRRVVRIATGVILGVMLSGPELLPALEYTKTGSRLTKREAGAEERPPIGLVSLPQLVLPKIYGTIEKGSFPILPNNERSIIESPAAGFTGLIATLGLTPLAWGSRRHRSRANFLVAIAFLGMAWCLNIPGLVWVMRLPIVNMLSYNRFVFASSFAILGLATIALETISTREIRWHLSYYVPVAIIICLTGWCIFRSIVLPQVIGQKLPQAIAAGQSVQWVEGMEGVRRIQRWFIGMYLSGATFCIGALAIWVWLRLKKNFARAAPLFIGTALLGELLFFDYGWAGQCDPSLYYPRIPALDLIAQSSPGRVIGYKCLPPSLLQVHGLLDVRGYDGVDPAAFVDLLNLGAAADSIKLDYAAVQYFRPQIAPDSFPDTVNLPPVLDLLGVRYLVCLNSDRSGYFVLTNPSALPRVFVPLSVEIEADPKNRLNKLRSPEFDPREVAYLEEQVGSSAAGQGQVELTETTPQQISIHAKMQSGGLIVLADQWNSGWRAYINDKVVPILRVDHALRGVIAPSGESTITFRYQPLSMRVGLALASLATIILITVCFTGVDRELPKPAS